MAPHKNLFPSSLDLRKGERTRLKLLHCAFLAIARDGYYRTTFQTIADRAKVSQPLVVKVFKTKEQIFPVVATHLLAQATRLTEDRLAAVTPERLDLKLKTYFEVSISLLEGNPDLARFYMNLHYLSIYDRSVQKINRAIRAQAISRLCGILEADQMRSRGADREAVASALHDYLTGFILNTISLGRPWELERLWSGVDRALLRGLD